MPTPRKRKTRPTRPSARKAPQQPRSRDTVAVILTAAERILAREGLDALSTVRIAEVAGISVGSLYQYFPNKESICGALVERTTAQYHQVLVAALAAVRALPIEVAFRGVIAGVLDVFRHNARLHGGLMEALPAAGQQALYRRYLAMHTDAIAHALAERGDEVRRPPELVAYVIVRAADGLARAMAQDPPDDQLAQALVRELSDMGVGYLRAGAGREKSDSLQERE